MREIPLTKGQVALVDDDKYKELSKYKWHVIEMGRNKLAFYAARAVRVDAPKWKCKQKTVFMHRELLGLKRGDPRQGDHINHKTLDNRMENLRIVTRQENQENKANIKGYSRTPSGKYVASIGHNGKKIALGSFTEPDDARAAYLAAKRIYHPTAPEID